MIDFAARKKKKILGEVEVEVEKGDHKKFLIFKAHKKEVFRQRIGDNEQIPMIIPPDEKEPFYLDVDEGQGERVEL